MRSISVVQALVLGLLAATPIACQDVSKRHVGGLAARAANMAREIVVALEPRHHTEAQIAAKKAKAEKEAKKKHGGRDVPAPDEFGPWDSTEDEFGSWVKRDVAAREPHHTEAQIAAKKAKADKAAAGKGKCKAAARDVDVETREPHHTEAQIAAKKAKAAEANCA